MAATCKNYLSLEALRSSLRSRFPPLAGAQPPVFLDNAAGSLCPASVVAAVAAVLTTRGVVNALPGYAWGREQEGRVLCLLRVILRV